MSGKDYVRLKEVREVEDISACSLNDSCANFSWTCRKKMAEFTNQLPCPRFKEAFKGTGRTKIRLFICSKIWSLLSQEKYSLLKNKSLLKSTLREIVHKQHNRLPHLKKICCFTQSSLVTTTPRCYRERFGGCYRCTLDSELETSPGS